jgi:hypothetical protein
VLAVVFVLGASPAWACHDRYDSYSHYHDRYGYPDDDCDSDGYYCDGYGWYESDRDDYRYHRRYYRDGGACVFHESVGAIPFDFLCTYR